jgi:hypothetical protein
MRAGGVREVGPCCELRAVLRRPIKIGSLARFKMELRLSRGIGLSCALQSEKTKMLSLFAINFHTARLAFEAQNAVVFRFLRLFSDTNKTEFSKISVGASAVRPAIQAPAQTAFESDRGKRRASVSKVHKKTAHVKKPAKHSK